MATTGKEKGRKKKESKEEMKEKGKEDENPLTEVVTTVTEQLNRTWMMGSGYMLQVQSQLEWEIFTPP